MHYGLAVLYVLFIGVIATQFGRRLSPSRTLGWWALFLFLGVAIVRPGAYHAVATGLGFELVSNFVFASLIALLLLLLADQATAATQTARNLRKMVAEQAARDFVAMQPEGCPIHALVVVPCYNEAQSLAALLPRLQRAKATASVALSFCLVDDGSRDGTWQELRRHAPGLAVRHLANVGVGGVLLTAFAIQRDLGIAYVVQCDGDGQHPVEEIGRLLEQAERERLDLLVGSRFCARGAHDESSTPSRRAGGLIIRALLGVFGRAAAVSDPTSGFRVFSAGLGRLLLGEMPDEYPEPETLALAASAGMRIGEVGVTMAPRHQGVSSINRLGAVRYMHKVITALIGLRLRLLVGGLKSKARA